MLQDDDLQLLEGGTGRLEDEAELRPEGADAVALFFLSSKIFFGRQRSQALFSGGYLCADIYNTMLLRHTSFQPASDFVAKAIRTDTMDDFQLIEEIKRGRHESFKVLLGRYQDRIYALCRYMLENPDDAEDAAQDAFVRAFQGIKSFTPTSSFYTWLYRIAVNTCLDYRRKFSLHSLFFTADNEGHIDRFPSHAPSPETAYAAKQSMQALQVALNSLSKKLRVVIVLKELEGLSYEEIAEVLDVSVGTVKSRLSRAREELKIVMKKFTEQK